MGWEKGLSEADIWTIKAFRQKQEWSYGRKVVHAREVAEFFVQECEKRGLNCHVSVGGLDSITLLLFLRDIGIDVPAVSVSSLEDVSIQRVHKQLGVERLKPALRSDGKPWTKAQI